jgi:AcrR family transcriptional regulator
MGQGMPRPPPTSPELIWERAEPTSRPAPAPLTRARIVRAAMTLADKQGLDAVSLRNVGAALEAGAMRLYGYVATKQELLELMVDAVYGELVAAGPLTGNWQSALSELARRTRRAAHKHTWFIDLVGGRPHLGPHALAHLEASLAALAATPTFGGIDEALRALRIVNAYTLGAIRAEASELTAERQSGLAKSDWQRATLPYLERKLSSGKFPQLARVIRDATHPEPDAVFEQGLSCVLDGIAAQRRC